MNTETLTDVTSGESWAFTPRRMVIAGYTARDRAKAQQHIDELAEQGIAPPPSIPAFYEVPVDLLDIGGGQIAVESRESSGEVEPVLFCTERGWFVGIGSDHTARDVERDSIPDSKASCPKPVSQLVLPVAEFVRRHDELILASWVDGRPYQMAPLGEMLLPAEIIAAYERETGGGVEDLVMFLGTVPILPGGFRYSDTFSASLVGAGETLLSCTYGIAQK